MSEVGRTRNDGGGANMGGVMRMNPEHGRAGEPDYGRAFGAELSARELSARKHNVAPSNQADIAGVAGQGRRKRFVDAAGNRMAAGAEPADLPYWMNNYDGLTVPYDGPSEEKENLLLRSAIRKAASTEQAAGSSVLRTDPITDGEVAYLKSMKDQSELAKFDEYVESFIDPRAPGNMKWLMEVYPDYVNRRLQQAHTDYEYALRNQMIDSWGINTFDDLHFKYLVDQGKIEGPRLQNRRGTLDDTYTPGFLSPFNFQSPYKGATTLRLPFSSAQHGKKPSAGINGWTVDRTNRPMGNGNDEVSLASGMYNPADRNDIAAPRQQTAPQEGYRGVRWPIRD